MGAIIDVLDEFSGFRAWVWSLRAPIAPLKYLSCVSEYGKMGNDETSSAGVRASCSATGIENLDFYALSLIHPAKCNEGPHAKSSCPDSNRPIGSSASYGSCPHAPDNCLGNEVSSSPYGITRMGEGSLCQGCLAVLVVILISLVLGEPYDHEGVITYFECSATLCPFLPAYRTGTLNHHYESSHHRHLNQLIHGGRAGVVQLWASWLLPLDHCLECQ